MVDTIISKSAYLWDLMKLFYIEIYDLLCAKVELLNEKDINEMINIISSLGYKKTYYLQNFLETSSNIGDIKKGRDINKKLIDSKNLVIKYRN